MSKHMKPSLSVITLALSGAAALLTPAYAQTAEVAEEEEIVVTGSLLRSTRDGSQLVTSVGAEELSRAGAGNATEALASVAQNQILTNSVVTVGARTGFATYANLRSLGSSNTLVLFDSHRIVNNPYQSLGVDLNSIPLNTIQRVDVLADGASSIYGSDAIAGVINYVPRRELTGLQIEASYRAPEHEGGDAQSFSAAGGIGSLREDGWNIYAGFTFRDRDAILFRDFAGTFFIPSRGLNRLNNTTFPANWSQAVGGVTTVAGRNPSRAGGCAPPGSLPTPGSATNCSYDTARETWVTPSQRETSYLIDGSLRLGEETLSLQYVRGEQELHFAIASNVTPNVPLPNTSPYYPGNGIYPSAPGQNMAQPVTVGFRAVELGSNRQRGDSMTERGMATLDGDIWGWDYELFALHSRSVVETELEGNNLRRDRVIQGLAGTGGAPFIDPFGPQTAAGLQWLRDSQILGEIQHAVSHLTMGGAQITGDLFQMPAGPLQVALAVEHQYTDTDFFNNPILVQGSGTGLDSSVNASGDRSASAATAEARIPLLDTLDINLSLRYDNYSDFGSTTNPKILIDFRPFDSLQFHASYNTGFRAPTLYDLFAPRATPQSTIRNNDPVLCTGGVVQPGGIAARDCNFQFRNLQGGNTNLDPETSDAYAIGFDIRPTDTLSFGLDYWSYQLEDTIGNVPEAKIFTLPQYTDLIVRCSTADAAVVASNPAIQAICAGAGASDPIAYVRQTRVNLGEVQTDGVDFTFDWTSRDFDIGSFYFGYRGTVVFNYEYQVDVGGAFFERAGIYADGFPVFDYSHNLTLGWDISDFSTRLTNRFLNGYQDCNQGCATGLLAPAATWFQQVDAYSLWDISTTFEGIDNLRITGRVSNIFDVDPPFSNKNVGVGGGWDERFTDPTGRAYSLTLGYTF